MPVEFPEGDIPLTGGKSGKAELLFWIGTPPADSSVTILLDEKGEQLGVYGGLGVTHVAPRAGLDFGFPYCHGRDTKDPDFGKLGDCSRMTPPVRTLGAHVAPLGVKFYTGTAFPEKYRNQVLIAEHGSWNRSTPLGYRIMVVKLDGNKAVSYEPFAEGWLRGIRSSRGNRTIGDAWGVVTGYADLADGLQSWTFTRTATGGSHDSSGRASPGRC